MHKMPWTMGSIKHVAEEAIAEARRRGEEVTFDFNEIPLIVQPTSDWRDIATIYDMAHRLRRAKAGYKD